MTLLLVLGACYLGFLGGLWLANLCAATQVPGSQRLAQLAVPEPTGSTYMRQYRVVPADPRLVVQARAILGNPPDGPVLADAESDAVWQSVMGPNPWEIEA
jgi:hypothetical protein